MLRVRRDVGKLEHGLGADLPTDCWFYPVAWSLIIATIDAPLA